MFDELAVDTNVFMHAEDKRQNCYDVCREFLVVLSEGEMKLCVDEGFSSEEARNRSQIAGEYYNFFVHGSLAYSVLAELASSKRILPVSKKVPDKVRRKITQAIHDPTDRVFVKVAFNSAGRVLSTHDEANYPTVAKTVLAKEIGVTVLRAEDMLVAFQK